MKIKEKLLKTKTNKSVPPGDIPPIVVKMFADELSVPLTNIINTSVMMGIWPEMWKVESVTPVPKIFPPKLIKKLEKHIWISYVQQN